MSVPSSETWDGPQQANPSADDLALVLAAAKAHLASLGQAIARLEHSPESNTEDDPAVLRRLALAPPAESRAVGLEARPSGCHSKGAPSNKRATGQHWAPRSRPLGTRARRLVIGGLAF